PTLRARYPKPAEDDQRWTASDRNLINEIHRGTAPEKGLEAYPAHLHIDLLPIGQKKGWGRKLMHTFWDKLRDLSASAVHLGVSVNNANAVAFYYHIGYHKIEGGEFGLMLGKHL
ncbi:MAG: GNAT family N-acetyltransferase, partial [Candidatus Promineifilaceae bacterium]